MKKPTLALFACALLVSAPASAQNASATYNETRLAQQEYEVRAINGRIEQIEYAINRLESALQKLQGDVDMRLSKMEQMQTAVASAAAAQAQMAQQAQTAQPQPPSMDINGTLGALKVNNGGRVTGGVNKPNSPPLPDVPANYGLTPAEQYDRAFNLLREANYADAEEAFKTLIDKYPKDKLIDNAKYWYGETLYVRGRFDEAAVAFADAYQQNPRGVKAPDSLLKLGISLKELDKKTEACVTFSELKSKYPKASAAIKSRADDERAKLKCSAR
ncbi:MAG: tol-pal system protein YbgF [Alphaproteobacteria bacterium]|nr:tol-pal system protein YbgF [Alphaproteobacteria bacterium]